MTVSKEIADDLDAPVTQEELTKALNHMPKNKSPGPDGFPNIFGTFSRHYFIEQL